MKLLFHLGNGGNMLKRAPIFVIGGNLLVSALVVISLGILTGPLYASYMEAIICLQRDGRQPQLKDLLTGLPRFRQLFPFIFLVLLIILGFKLFAIPGLLMLTMWIYALPLMAVRRLTLVPALNESAIMVKEKGFFKHLGFLFLIFMVPSVLLNVLGSESDLLKVLYLVLIPPIQLGCLASLYLANFPTLTEEIPQAATAADLPGRENACHL